MRFDACWRIICPLMAAICATASTRSTTQSVPADQPPHGPVALGTSTLPGQPFASYWHPSTLLAWSPATDPDAPYNRSNVPLSGRFSDSFQNVNAHAHAGEARVMPLVAPGRHRSTRRRARR